MTDAEWIRSLPTTAPEGRVDCVRNGPYAAIVLNHDRARNALTTRMMADLVDIVDTLERDPPRVWSLTGEGRAFCAGGHLGDVRAHLATPRAGERMARLMTNTLSRLSALPAVGLVGVHGPAVGGGAELTTIGDVCFAGPGARFAWVQAQRGVAPGWGGAARLVARIGAQRATHVLLVDPVLSPERAETLGLAIAVESVDDAVDDAVSAVLALDEAVVHAVLAQVREEAPESTAFARVWGHRAHLERLDALPWGRS